MLADADRRPFIAMSSRRAAYRTKIALAIVHILVAIAQLVMYGATNTFDFRATVIGLARQGPPDDSGLPAAEIASTTQINAAYIFGLANAAAAVGYIFSLFFDHREADFVERGVMPFVWLSMLFSGGLLQLGVCLVAGVSAWTELTCIVALEATVFFLYWIGTFVNSDAHIDATRGRRFSWAFIVMAAVPQIAALVVVYSSLVSLAQNGGPLLFIATPIVNTILWWLIPIAVCGKYASIGIKTSYTLLIALYVLHTVRVLVVSWLAILSFSGDGIVYP